MPEVRPKLIIIPGIGDDTNVYYSFAERWKRLGYDTHVIAFTWADPAAALDLRMEAFLQQLNRFQNEPLYLIGISAGGTSAVNALALRDNVVCSPLDTMPSLRNPLLAASIAQVKINLAAFTPVQRQRILSVHALFDQVVDVRLSRAPGVAQKRLYSIIHAPTIYLAMTAYARLLSRFFKNSSA